jgi:hypothetical protein
MITGKEWKSPSRLQGNEPGGTGVVVEECRGSAVNLRRHLRCGTCFTEQECRRLGGVHDHANRA